MNSNIYIVVPPSTSKFAEAEAINPKYDDSERVICPKCKQFLSGSKWCGEKTIKVNKKNIPDFLYLYGGSDILFVVSENAYNVLKTNNIKGIVEVEPIDKIFLKGDMLSNRFYQIVLERALYSIDHMRSKIVYGNESPVKKCNLCNPLGRTKDLIFGLYFNPLPNIDLDIFNVYEMGGAVFLSERFVNICKENHLTGLYYENITEYNSANGIYSEDEILKMLSNDL